MTWFRRKAPAGSPARASRPGAGRDEDKPMETSRWRGELLLTTEQTAWVLGLKKRTLERWRIEGCGPKYLRLSARCIRYRQSDLDAWLDGRVRRSTSDPGGLPEAAYG